MAADKLETTEYDLIVIGTGFVESLVASAAARAGKSVLHLDAAPSYGSHWAALHLDEFLSWASALQARGSDVAVNGHVPTDSQQHHDIARDWEETPVHWHEAAAGPSGLYRDVQLWTAGDADPGPSREYNIDLAPKVASCAGPLVRALIQSGAHNYVEFKLLQGSYVWREGRLLPVPATKADVFRSRALSGGDKRSLMRFLSACASAAQGQGHLKDAFGQQPFVELLDAERLSLQLQDFLLYAIVLCDGSQRSAEAHHQGATVPDAAETSMGLLPTPSADTSTAGSEANSTSCAAPSQRTANRGCQQPAPTLRLTAAEAWAALQLYTASTGKYAAGGSAFMAPVYGVGELPQARPLQQAFCRVAAVAGATYVLRHPVAALLTERSTGACAGVRTAAGQTLRCGALAADCATLTEVLRRCADSEKDADGRGSSDTGLKAPGVARAICIVDASLQDGESQLFAVMPPRALPSPSAAAIRIVQVGQATCASPAGRYLLYLTTPATPGQSAAQQLGPAVAAFTQRSAAGAAARSPASQQGVMGAGALHSPAEASVAAALPDSRASDDQNGLMDVRPRLLMAAYYTQTVPSSSAGSLPNNVACCGAPDGSLDFGSALQAAEQCFTRLFPDADAPFLTSATSGAGADSDDGSDEDTIEALQAALGGLGDTDRAQEAH